MIHNFNLQIEEDIPDKLQEIILTVIDTEECKKIWSRLSDYFIVTDNNVCTFTKIGEGMCGVSF